MWQLNARSKASKVGAAKQMEEDLSEPYENVRYWDEESWKKYFTEDLGSLYRSSIAVKAIGDWLRREVGRPLKEVLRDGTLFKILLGGLREDGTFSENGLAVFYREIFGTGIDKADEFIGRLKAGMPLEVAAEGLMGAAQQTPFLNAVDKVIGSLERVFRLLRGKGFKVEVKGAALERVKDPNEACERVRDFLQACLSISPNYNPQTFFIASLYRITRRYMKLAYPRLSDEGTFNYVKDLLGLSKIIVPETPDGSMNEEYTVWGFEEGSVGYEIVVNVVNSAWDVTELDPIKKFFSVKSEREVYFERAINAWLRIASGARDVVREMGNFDNSSRWGILQLKNPHIHPRASSRAGSCKLDGINLVELRSRREMLEERKILLTEFLDYLSPQLFLNIGLVDRRYDYIVWGAAIRYE